MEFTMQPSFQCSIQVPIRFPRAVYRFVSEKSHADALLSGNVWISTLSACRAYEEAGRGDPGEGSVHYNSGHAKGSSGDLNFETIAERSGVKIGPGCSNFTITNCSRSSLLPDAFVICTTLAFSPEMLSTTFGPYCVEIMDSDEFYKLITIRLDAQFKIRESARGPVIYRARNFQGLEPEPGPLGFVKPPDQYEHQQEFRMLWIPKEPTEIKPFLLKVPEIITLCRRRA